MFKRDDSKNIFHYIAEFSAIVMTVVYAIYISDAVYGYLPADLFLHSWLNNIVFYGPLSLIAMLSLASVWRKGLILKIVFISVWALIIIYSFFPAFFAQLF